MLEIIAETLEDARAIEQGGGDRIELVSSLREGGLTPSYGLVKAILREIKIPVNVMIRPHARSFHYSEDDVQVMREDAKIFHALGVKHVVLGMLDSEGLPCLNSMKEVLEDTNFTITFHRAIDESSNIMKSLERLGTYANITHILTSGGPGKAEEHLDVLKNMIRLSKSQKIIVASGVNHDNLRAIKNELSFKTSPGNGDYAFDMHAGTAVRNHSIDHPVVLKEVQRLADIYRHHEGKKIW